MSIKNALCLALLVATAILGLGFATGQADAGQKQSAPNFLPLKEGAKWHYTLDVDGESVKATMQVAKKEKLKGVNLLLMETVIDGQVVSSDHFSSNEKGIFQHSQDGKALDQAICSLKYPAKAGQTWQQTLTVDGETIKVSCKIGQEEEVSVPAGKFKAISVRMEMEDSEGGVVVITTWFAADVGIVRQQAELPGLDLLLQLEKYEAARK